MAIDFDLPKINPNVEYYIHVGGRYNGRTIYYIKNTIEILFGGEAEVYYNGCDKYYNFIIKNDDIIHFSYRVYSDELKQISITTIIRRMCECYDATMRYKYRDYEKESKNG